MGCSIHRTLPPFHDPDACPKILLAEDDNDMRRFLVKALENAGYEVIDYDNGMSAYRRLREEPFELLLTDIVMPEMDGIELARRAAELDPDIKIMFITGFAAVALNAGFEGPEGRQGAVQAVPPARPRQRGAEDAGGLIGSGTGRSAACRCRRRADIGWHPYKDRARSSAGEHYVDIVGVTGSIPVAPTISARSRVDRGRGPLRNPPNPLTIRRAAPWNSSHESP